MGRSTNAINGEYWITADGTTIFCDGDADISTPNHLIVVAQHAWQLLLDGLRENGSPVAVQIAAQLAELFDEGVVDFPSAREVFNNLTDSLHRGGRIDDAAVDDSYAWLAGQAREDHALVSLAMDPYSEGDANRTMAIRKWQWIRIAGGVITIPAITRAICKRLADGLYEICETEGLPEFTEMTWQVESLSPAAYSADVSGLLLEDPKTLRRHMGRVTKD